MTAALPWGRTWLGLGLQSAEIRRERSPAVVNAGLLSPRGNQQPKRKSGKLQQLIRREGHRGGVSPWTNRVSEGSGIQMIDLGKTPVGIT